MRLSLMRVTHKACALLLLNLFNWLMFVFFSLFYVWQTLRNASRRLSLIVDWWWKWWEPKRVNGELMPHHSIITCFIRIITTIIIATDQTPFHCTINAIEWWTRRTSSSNSKWYAFYWESKKESK
jgi:hypothetical protein